jgi:MoxR-like ATPase
MDDPNKHGFRQALLHGPAVTPSRTGSAFSSAVRSPLHTSGSASASRSGVASSPAVKPPLYSSGSVAANRSAVTSSSGVRSVRSSGSVLAQSSSGMDPYAAKGGYWAGPEHVPESVAELGVRQSVLEDLALKILYTSGPFSLRELVAHIRLPFSVVNELLRRMRAEQLCEVTGMSGNVPQIAITSQGRSRATELLMANQYTGPAPVSLEHYKQQVQEQSARHLDVDEPVVAGAFAHLVLDPEILEKLGTALNSGTSIFLYGPSGTGKTAMATAVAKVLAIDRVWIPFAVEVEGQIICVYDPDAHKRNTDAAAQTGDARWVLCHRPSVLVGGELTLEMLELQYNPITKFYSAPVQMKANNGVLIIDDFGRQRMRPEELLNRWVVPLDRRIDFLGLAGGKKIEIPFEPCVVFATNLDPSTLGDEAFLRRIQTKIKVGSLSEKQFHDIFQAVCTTGELQCDSAVIDALIRTIRTELKQPLRACHPQDLVNRICWKARYKRTKPCLDRDTLLAAADEYFLREPDMPMSEVA